MKVGLYARVSTDTQTTDNQIIRLEEWSERCQWTVVDRYVDVASGKLARRPELDRMMADAKKHRFDLVVAVKLDRLGRSVINLRNVVEDLNTWNVGLKMLDQEIDTTTSSGRFMLTILSAVAELEREMISERTKDGQNRAIKQGKAIGRKKVTLSDYQIDKARKIIEDNPNITGNELARQFEGISRNTLINGLKDLGIFPVQKTGSVGVYKETTEKKPIQKTNV